jgi:phage-related protein
MIRLVCSYIRYDIYFGNELDQQAVGLATRRDQDSSTHELRLNDRDKTWRVIYRIDPDAIVIVEVFQKQTNQTSQQVIDVCRQRLSRYDATSAI